MARRPLVELPRALIEAQLEATSYAVCHRAAMNGAIPCERTPTGRWLWREEDFDMIVEGLGLSSSAYAA